MNKFGLGAFTALAVAMLLHLPAYAEAIQGIQIKPAASSAGGLKKLVESNASIKLKSNESGKIELVPVESRSLPSVTVEVVNPEKLASKGNRLQQASTVTKDGSVVNPTVASEDDRPKPSAESWIEFVPAEASGKSVLTSKLVSDWSKQTEGKIESDQGKRVEYLIQQYNESVQELIVSESMVLFVPPKPDDVNTDAAKLVMIQEELRDGLIRVASDSSSPDAGIAAAVLIDNVNNPELQGEADGMQRVSLAATAALYEAASGVALVLKDGNREGICTLTADGTCITAAHVVKGVVEQPQRITVQFHIRDENNIMRAVSVPLMSKEDHGITLLNKWAPQAFVRTSQAGVEMDVSPVLDCAFLRLNLQALTQQKAGLLARAKKSRVSRHPCTSQDIKRRSQFFHISYDPAQPPQDGPQIQFRCGLLCPTVIYSDQDTDEVFNGLFWRCLKAKAASLQNNADINPLNLCGGPIREGFIKNTLLADKQAPALKYSICPLKQGNQWADYFAICYEATTLKGDSGAPVFKYNDAHQQVEIVAIHIGGDDSGVPRTFTAERSAYAAPVSIIDQADYDLFCTTP